MGDSIRQLDLEDTGLAGAGSGYIRGDYDPKNFSYKKLPTRSELLLLFLRNPKIQKATVWFAGEIMRMRWEFDLEQPIIAPKHGTDYPFKAFNKWLEWIGFMQEALKAVMWSLLFGDTILVFYDGEEKNAEEYQDASGNNEYHRLHLKKSDNPMLKCKAFYEMNRGNGYVIEKVDDFFGIPTIYRIQMRTYKSTENVIYYVDAARVVRFSAPQKELKYSGTSNVTTIYHDCLVQEQIKRAVAVQANLLQSGILAIKASNPTEKNLVADEIGDSFSSMRRIFYSNPEELDKLFKLIIPDLNINQMAMLSELMQKDIATGMDMSISNLEGAPQGALSSAEYDTLNTYAKVHQLQAHYTRAMEEAFFMLGKQDTTFTWGDPAPKTPEKDAPNSTEDGDNSSEKSNDNSNEDVTI